MLVACLQWPFPWKNSVSTLRDLPTGSITATAAAWPCCHPSQKPHSYPWCQTHASQTRQPKSYKVVTGSSSKWLATSAVIMQLSAPLVILMGPQERSHQHARMTIVLLATMLQHLSTRSEIKSSRSSPHPKERKGFQYLFGFLHTA